MSKTTELRRHGLGPAPVIDGRPAGGAARRWQRRIERLLVSKAERDEAELERRLAARPTISRANVVTMTSAQEQVGKTTSTFALGNLLADRLRLRVVAVDANPNNPTLSTLAASQLRCRRSLAELFSDIERIETAAQLRGYVSPLPSGLHLLGAPHDATVMSRLGSQAYGELLALLCIFYDIVILDLGTGVAGELVQSTLRRADQAVLVTTPESVTSAGVLSALEQLPPGRIAVVANEFHARGPADVLELERRLCARRLDRSVALPHDERLAAMLESRTYQLDALDRTSRMAIKRLGLVVAEQLV